MPLNLAIIDPLVDDKLAVDLLTVLEAATLPGFEVVLTTIFPPVVLIQEFASDS